MKERPIPFIATMVRAIMADIKRQTRRLVKPEIVEHIKFMGGSNDDGTEFEFIGLRYGQWTDDKGKLRDAEWLIYCTEYPEEGVIPVGQLYGAIGDRMWVREAWRTWASLDATAPRNIVSGAAIQYEAGGNNLASSNKLMNMGKYRPPMFMPRWASRILLEITNVRVERLQDISEEDALAEGVTLHRVNPSRAERMARDAYQMLWESINGPGSWDANPWVWVIEFKRIEVNHG